MARKPVTTERSYKNKPYTERVSPLDWGFNYEMTMAGAAFVNACQIYIRTSSRSARQEVSLWLFSPNGRKIMESYGFNFGWMCRQLTEARFLWSGPSKPEKIKLDVEGIMKELDEPVVVDYSGFYVNPLWNQ